ncbi:hypothetical protein E4U14_000773, partial [Claviceps sp. LM454 group G7]
TASSFSILPGPESAKKLRPTATNMKKWMTKLDIEDDWHLMDGPGQDEGLSPISIEYELTKFSDQYQR